MKKEILRLAEEINTDVIDKEITLQEFLKKFPELTYKNGTDGIYVDAEYETCDVSQQKNHAIQIATMNNGIIIEIAYSGDDYKSELKSVELYDEDDIRKTFGF